MASDRRPIIHVRHDSIEPGSTLTPGTPGNAFRPGFGPMGDEPLITKSVNSAFIGTDLDLRLKRLGAKHVVAFGISTDQCVSTTIRTGANMGWDMILVARRLRLLRPSRRPRAARSRPSRSTPRTSPRSRSNSAAASDRRS